MFVCKKYVSYSSIKNFIISSTYLKKTAVLTSTAAFSASV